MNLQQSVLSTPDPELGEAIASTESLAAQLCSFGESVSDEASVEALKDLSNSLRSLHAQFASSIADMFSIGKRKYGTEFGDWERKSKRSIDRVESMEYSKAAGYPVDYPTGMKLPYPKVMTTLTVVHDSLDIHKILSSAMNTTDAILVAISNSQARDCDRKLKSALVEVTALFDKITKPHKALTGMFDLDDARMRQTEFGKMFDNMQQLTSFRTALGNIDSAVSDLPNITKAVDLLDTNIDTCVAYMVDDHSDEEFQPTTAFIKQFAQYLGKLGTVVSTYGDVALRGMALEHNTVLMYNSLLGK